MGTFLRLAVLFEGRALRRFMFLREAPSEVGSQWAVASPCDGHFHPLSCLALSTLNGQSSPNRAPLRPVSFFAPEVDLTHRPDDTWLMRSADPLADYDHRVGDWLDFWAREAPERIFIVEQTNRGERTVRYAEARDATLVLAEGMLGWHLGPDRPIAILAANGIDHALVMLAALYVGIPIAPIAPAYALQTSDYTKLSYVFEVLTPGMVMVDDGELYRKPMQHALNTDIRVIALRNWSASPNMRDLRSLKGDGSHRDRVRATAARVGWETIAKFLFTSGSTGLPKAVINTHGMICSNS